MEIGKLNDEFKVTIVEMIKELGRMDEQRDKLEVFNEELENRKKN